MSQRTRRFRISVLIAMITALVVGSLAGMTTPANALQPDPTAVSNCQPLGANPGDACTPFPFLASIVAPNEVYRALTNDTGDAPQDAGSLFLGAVLHQNDLAASPPDTTGVQVVNGERLIVEVSDGLGANCNTTGKYIGFAALPTVAVLDNTAGVSISTTLQGSSPGNALRGAANGSCASPFSPAQTDQLLITITNAPPGGAVVGGFLIGGVKYFVGSQAGVGPAVVRWASDAPPRNDTGVPSACNAGAPDAARCTPPGTDTAPAPGLRSNAYITNLKVETAAANAIQPGANRPVGDITLTETNFDATTPFAADNAVCINLLNGNVHFVDPGTATVTGGDTAGAPTLLDDGSTIMIPYTGDPTKKSVTTLSGVLVNASGAGPVRFDVTQCDSTTGSDTTAATNRTITNPGGAGGNNVAPDAGFNSAIDHYTRTFTNMPFTDNRLLLVVVTSERFAGINRDDTARIIGDRTLPCPQVPTFGPFGGFTGMADAPQSFAIIARDDDFADALTASYVAGQLYYAPILLVKTHGPIPQETLDSLHFHGVTDVFVMGGNTAVGDDVVAQLQDVVSVHCNGANRRTPEDQDVHIRVQRISGPTRFDTARAAGLFVFGGNTIGRLNLTEDPSLPTLRTMILANGRNFPDAQSAGPMAWSGKAVNCGSGADCAGYPILLSDAGATTLPQASNSFITDRNIEQVIIVGGTDAVPQAIEDALVARGLNVVRLAGANRQLTAIEVAKFEYQRLLFGCCSNGTVALARGDFFTDALALGPRAGLLNEPILLTQDPGTVGADTDAFLTILSKNFGDPNNGGILNINANGFDPPADAFFYSVFHLEIAGGTAAVSTAAENEALNSLIGT